MKRAAFYIFMVFAVAPAWGGNSVVIVNPSILVQAPQAMQLEGSVPAAGSTVSKPSAVTLNFTHPLPSRGNYRVQVTDEYGSPVVDGDPSVSGKVLTVHLQPNLASGYYTVRYTVYFSTDSMSTQRISDSFQFSVQ